MKKTKLLSALLPATLVSSLIPLAATSCNKDKSTTDFVNCDNVEKEVYGRLNASTDTSCLAVFDGFVLQDGLSLDDLVVDVENQDFYGIISAYAEKSEGNTFKVHVYFQSALYLSTFKWAEFDLSFSHKSLVNKKQVVSGLSVEFIKYTIYITPAATIGEQTIWTKNSKLTWYVPTEFYAYTSLGENIEDLSDFTITATPLTTSATANAVIEPVYGNMFNIKVDLDNLEDDSSIILNLRIRHKKLATWYDDTTIVLNITSDESLMFNKSFDSTNHTCQLSYCNVQDDSVVIPEYFEKDSEKYYVTTINTNCFNHNTNLKHLTLNTKINNIGGTFKFTNLESITVPQNNEYFTSIGTVAGVSQPCNCIIAKADPTTIIVGCANTKIPETVKTIGPEAFAGLYNLEKIDLPNNVETISKNAFNLSCYLKNANLNKVKKIEEGAFAGCYGLNQLDLGSELQTIDTEAFRECIGLTSITIPATTTSIESDSFLATKNVKDFVVKDGNTKYLSKWDNQERHCIIDVNNKMIICGCAQTDIPNDPDHIDAIGTYCFAYHDDITTMNIPTGIKTIFSRAFENCTNLQSIDLSNVTTLHIRSFYGCESLTSVTLNSAMDAIPTHCFKNCYSLKTVDLPTSCAKINAGAFSYCYKLETVNNMTDSLTTIGKEAFVECLKLNTKIPKSVTSMGNAAFGGCCSLTEVDLSQNAITHISEDAFEACLYLKTVKLPATCTTLENNAFQGCVSLESINLENVTSLGNYCFAANYSLQSVTLNNTLTTIPKYAFSNTGLTDITIPDSVTTLETGAFESCLGLTSVDTKNVTTIKSSVFYGCENLTEVKISPNGDTSWYWNITKLEDEVVNDPEAIAIILQAGSALTKK